MAAGGTASGGDSSAAAGVSAGAGAGGQSDGGPTTVTLTVYERWAGAVNAALVAFQDGDGEWTTITGTNGVYQELAHGERYGFAVVCDSYSVRPHIFQMTVTETTELTYAVMCDPTTTQANKVSGTLSGLSGGFTSIGVGQGQTTSYTTAYQLYVSSGTYDFVAARKSGTTANKLVVSRGVVVGGDTVWNIDFANEGFAPEAQTLTVNNLDGTWTVTQSSSSLITSRGTALDLGGSAAQWLALPAGQGVTNDMYLLDVTASQASGNFRRVSRYVANAGEVSLDMPTANVTGASASAYQTAPSPLLEFKWDADPSADVYVLEMDGAGYIWEASVSPGWLGASDAYTYRQPDLSGVSGWDPSWDAPTPGTIAWTVRAESSSLDLGGALFQRNIVAPTADLDGLEQRSAMRGGAFTVP